MTVELAKFGSYYNFRTFMADACSFHVNCGGDDLTIKESKKRVVYEGDAEVEGAAAKYFVKKKGYWGLSSTGDFMDDNNDQNMRYIETLSSGNISGVYTTARLSPLSLTYFGYCLENGEYTLQLHFAEIYFTNDKTYNSLGNRIFDIYIQVCCHISGNIFHFHEQCFNNLLVCRRNWCIRISILKMRLKEQESHL